MGGGPRKGRRYNAGVAATRAVRPGAGTRRGGGRRRSPALPADLTAERCRQLYRQMVLIRRFEEHAAEAYAQAKVGGFLHLYIGEEAVAVGALAAARPTDDVLSHYRDHGYALARGCDPTACMAELFGRATGVSRGMGGSMHLADRSRHFWGGHAIVGSHIPIGTGMAYAAKLQGRDDVVLEFFGDGATGNGIFHEGLNMAALWKVPVVFVCENNLYGMGATLAEESPVRDMVIRAEGYTMPALQCDGMDVVAVYETLRVAIAHAREGRGPYFVECLTYRFRGHSMADPELYRDKDEVRRWRALDPITRFGARLVAERISTEQELTAVGDEVEEEMLRVVAAADAGAVPDLATLSQLVYAHPIDPTTPPADQEPQLAPRPAASGRR